MGGGSSAMSAAHAADLNDFALGEAIPPLSKAEKTASLPNLAYWPALYFGVISSD